MWHMRPDAYTIFSHLIYDFIAGYKLQNVRNRMIQVISSYILFVYDVVCNQLADSNTFTHRRQQKMSVHNYFCPIFMVHDTIHDTSAVYHSIKSNTIQINTRPTFSLQRFGFDTILRYTIRSKHNLIGFQCLFFFF